jgi:hypothetical protein
MPRPRRGVTPIAASLPGALRTSRPLQVNHAPLGVGGALYVTLRRRQRHTAGKLLHVRSDLPAAMSGTRLTPQG